MTADDPPNNVPAAVAVPQLAVIPAAPAPDWPVLCHASCLPLSSRHHDKRLEKHFVASHVRRQQLVCIVAKPKLAILTIAAGPCIALLRRDSREGISTGHRQYRTRLASDGSALDGCLAAVLRRALSSAR